MTLIKRSCSLILADLMGSGKNNKDAGVKRCCLSFRRKSCRMSAAQSGEAAAIRKL